MRHRYRPRSNRNDGVMHLLGAVDLGGSPRQQPRAYLADVRRRKSGADGAEAWVEGTGGATIVAEWTNRLPR